MQFGDTSAPCLHERATCAVSLPLSRGSSSERMRRRNIVCPRSLHGSVRVVSPRAPRIVRVAWVAAACVIAFGGLAWALGARSQGESVANVGTFARYALVGAVIAVAGYAVYRFGSRLAPRAAWQKAALDALVAVVIVGPAIYMLITIAFTLSECSTGRC